MDNILKILTFTKPSTGSFLVDIVYWLVTITASVGLGVILFTLILKLITLPFDYMSRSSMRKNNIIMEEMRPELEKLQKQYADNKDLYNQKMMALYKKNGYSMFGACLPMILTIVIFIVAINAFTDYSKFQNRDYFYDMTCAYNEVVYEGLQCDDKYIIKTEDGSLVIDTEAIKNDNVEGSIAVDGHEIKVNVVNNSSDVNLDSYEITTTDCYVKYVRNFNKSTSTWGDYRYELLAENLASTELKTENNNYLKNSNGQTLAEYLSDETIEGEKNAQLFVKDIRQLMSANEYRSQKKSFLWVKNIWVNDSPNKHPIESDWESFKSTNGYSDKEGTFSEEDYAEIIAKLETEKNQANGYFILVIITILVSFLSQFVTNKTQKAQMELQTVDGQGAASSKIMMWMMPILMAVFAFMYTAAFSIYIILSSVLSLLTTLGINAIVDLKYKKKKTDNDKKEIIRGRVYVPKEEPKQVNDKKKKEEEKPDFLSGIADKKKKKK